MPFVQSEIADGALKLSAEIQSARVTFHTCEIKTAHVQSVFTWKYCVTALSHEGGRCV